MSSKLFATPWTVAHQAPVSMEFSRQEYWSGLPLPTRDLPDPATKPMSPAFARTFFTTEATWEAHICRIVINSTLSYGTRLETN